jgi:hypothetical protein
VNGERAKKISCVHQNGETGSNLSIMDALTGALGFLLTSGEGLLTTSDTRPQTDLLGSLV